VPPDEKLNSSLGSCLCRCRDLWWSLYDLLWHLDCPMWLLPLLLMGVANRNNLVARWLDSIMMCICHYCTRTMRYYFAEQAVQCGRATTPFLQFYHLCALRNHTSRFRSPTGRIGKMLWWKQYRLNEQYKNDEAVAVNQEKNRGKTTNHQNDTGEASLSLMYHFASRGAI
jgi:hypothetical protein